MTELSDYKRMVSDPAEKALRARNNRLSVALSHAIDRMEQVERHRSGQGPLPRCEAAIAFGRSALGRIPPSDHSASVLPLQAADSASATDALDPPSTQLGEEPPQGEAK